jgi:TonB family protein
MRSAAVALCALLLPTTIFSQDHLTAPAGETSIARTGDFDFSGAMLRISVDSVNDHQVCSVTTVNNGAWIAVAGDRTAMVTTMNNRNVDYDRPAFLRIGEAPPFRLGVSRRPHFIAIPFSKSADVIRALYTQQRVRLRFTEWPDGSMFDEELEPGDFAAAYDRGVELCAWPKLPVTAVHPADAGESAAPNSSDSPTAPAQDFRWYLAAVESLLRSKWSALASQVNVDDVGLAHCVVSFTVERNGAVKGISVSQSSGDASVDSAALNAVKVGSPLPPLPSDRTGPLVLRAEFDRASATLKISQ